MWSLILLVPGLYCNHETEVVGMGEVWWDGGGGGGHGGGGGGHGGWGGGDWQKGSGRIECESELHWH